MKLKKGDITRNAILDAALRCYHRLGYASTTQEKILQEAGVSMGALTYHFPSIAELTRAAIDRVFQLRIERHRSAIEAAIKQSFDFENTLEIYWRGVTDPLFSASHELEVAARTNAALSAVLAPAHERFRRQWRRNLRKLHPEWNGTGDMFDFAVRYSMHLTEGMALDHLLHGSDEQHMRDLRDYLKDTLEGLLEAGRAGQQVRQLLAPGRARRASLNQPPSHAEPDGLASASRLEADAGDDADVME